METPKQISEQEKRSKLVHDIRSSLAVIKTSSEVALLNTAMNPVVQTILQNHIAEVDNASNILENLL